MRVPRGWAGERVIVRVDAATHEGVVYVNDVKVAEHVGGYLPFEADITEHVTPGEEFRLTIGVNNELTMETIPPGVIEVAADGRRQQKYFHDFYNYAGLARSVWLASRPAVHVADITVVTRLDGTTGTRRLPGRDRGRRRGAGATRGCLGRRRRGIRRGDRHARGRRRDALAAGRRLPLRPHGRGGRRRRASSTSYALPVGIRTLEVRGAEFLINGEPFYFTGFGKHEDTAVRGKGHDDAYLVHDFQLMDWIGANSFRTSHYPYAEEVMEFADRHGIVVIDETPAVGLNLGLIGGITGAPKLSTWSPETIGDAAQAAHAQVLRELVARDKNHPSVVMWSITNEPASNEEGAREYFAPLVELTRELDPSRPVTFVNVMMAPAGTDLVADLFDVICLNRYYGWYTHTGDLVGAEAALEAELRQWESLYGKPLIMTEYGGDTMPGVHSVFDQPWSRGVPDRAARHVPPRARPHPRAGRRAGLELRRLPDERGHLPRRREQEGRVHPRPQAEGRRARAACPVDRPARRRQRPLTGAHHRHRPRPHPPHHHHRTTAPTAPTTTALGKGAHHDRNREPAPDERGRRDVPDEAATAQHHRLRRG